MPVLAPTVPPSSNRREQVIWTRLRLGHTHLTHRRLLLGEPPPYCKKSSLTQKHTASGQLVNPVEGMRGSEAGKRACGRITQLSFRQKK
ncbi:hypothetical protein TNCV_391081 [Trichonephila clavipes]|nr:hypothetical protein TNCV_391081 [Trichonephila clavipes]